MNKHIAVDLDDVVLDFVGGLRLALKKEYDVDIPEDAITDFNLAPFLNPIIGRSWWAWLRDRDWLWKNFPAVDGAIGTLEKLRLEGYYLELVTSKPKWAEHATYQWLGKRRPPFQSVRIVGQDDSKVDFTDAPILIDDKMQNIQEFVDAGRSGLLFTRPHNVREEIGLPASLSIVRVDNWQEVYATLKELEKLGVFDGKA